jgi:hypothetical protein
MNDLMMPSDVKQASHTPAPSSAPAEQNLPIEPPSAKLIVRLFVIPLFVVAAAVGVMFIIGLLAGGPSTMEDALERLRAPGGQRTTPWLVGPGAKQRFMDAKALTDHMKAGMNESERIMLTGELIDILDNHTSPSEGQVQHFLLLALGRVWQIDPSQPPMDSAEAVAARRAAIDALQRYGNADHVETRKAAVLAQVYWAGRSETERAIPQLLAKLRDEREDLDVRIAAATALGPLAGPDDEQVTAALGRTMRQTTDPRQAELIWSAALSLAQLNQPEAAGTILMLLDRDELSQMQYYDRETDPRNPRFRNLSDQEQQRILINTMMGARYLEDEQVQARLREIARNDPSPRVQAAGREILQGVENPEAQP